MRKDQDFPISIEVQLLGGRGTGERSTANLCTPGTNVVMNGALVTDALHQLDVQDLSPATSGCGWRWRCHGDGLVRHLLNGEAVLRYEKPQVGGGVVSNFDPAAKKDGKLLSEGTISLQSESHPIEFRKVELLNLVGLQGPEGEELQVLFREGRPAACRYR